MNTTSTIAQMRTQTVQALNSANIVLPPDTRFISDSINGQEYVQLWYSKTTKQRYYARIADIRHSDSPVQFYIV